jgi:C1A family cysteine protease
LARGVPVIFDMRPDAQFHAFKGDGVLDIPGVMNGNSGHTMVAVGCDSARLAFRIQNSWGRTFGEGGHAWLSYGFWARNVHVGYVID